MGIYAWDTSAGNKDTTITVVKDDFRQKWMNYYLSIQKLEQAITQKLDTNISDVNAQVVISQARIDDIANDNKLTPSEKSDVLKEWNTIAGEKATIDAQADGYSVTTEKTTYDNAYTALANYLNGGATYNVGTPLWISDLTTTITIDGPTFRSNFATYYNAKVALLKKIQDAAKGYVMQTAVGYDSTFDQGLNYWSADAWTGSYTGPDINKTRSDIVVQAADGSMGGNAIKFTNTNGNTVIYNRYPIPVDVNKTYKVRTRVKTLTGTPTGTNVHLGVVTLDANFNEITGGAGTHRWGTTGGKYSTDGNWQTIEWTITGTGAGASQFRAGTVYVRLCALINYQTTGSTSEVDSLEFFDITDAAKAQTDATSALGQLTDIAADNKLTPGEKQDTQREWTKIQNEKTNIDSQADTYGIVTEKTAYDGTYTTLSNYIGPLLSDLTATVTIVGSDFRTNFNSYYTAREALLLKVAQSAKARMDAISIGSRNLFKNTAYSAATWSDYWSTFNVSTWITVADTGVLSGRSTKVTTSASGGAYQRFKGDKVNQNAVAFTSGQAYMLTGKMKVDAGATVTGMTVSYENSGTTMNLTLTSAWQSFSMPFTGDGTHNTITFYLNGAGTYYLADVKLEEGNRATTWTPAPEDVDASVTQVRTDLRLTAPLPSSITMDGNGFTATSTADPNAYARMDYRGLYIRGGALWVDGGLPSTDSMNLVYNSTGKFTNISGYATGWQNNITPENVDGRTALKITTSANAEATASTKTFTVKASTTYSWGVWVKQTSNSNGVDVFFLGQYSGQTGTAYTLVRNLKTGVVPTIFTYYSGTFTTDASTISGYMRIDNNGSNNAAAASCWFSELMVIEGDYSSKPMPTWGPSKDDLIFSGQDYNGVKLDSTNGISVTSSKNTLKMNATDGLKLTRTSDSANIFSLDSNGNLALQGAIALQSGSTITWGTNGANPPSDWLASRGENLVTNGNGLLGDKTNWMGSTTLNFDKSDLPDGAYGAFTYTGAGKTFMSDEIIPIDPNQTYQVSAMVKGSLATGQNISLGFSGYDIDKNQIIDNNYLYLSGSLTTLAQDLKNGDTVVYLTSLAGWDNTTSTTDNTQRRFMFWNYKDSTGYTYPAETYTRNTTTGGTWADSGMNKTANTITLATAWSGGTYTAGTQVSQGWNGSYYIYAGGINSAITTDWQNFSGLAGGVSLDGTSYNDRFAPGTRGVKFYFASGGSTGTTKIANLSISTTVRQSDFNGQNIAAKITADDNAITMIGNSIDLTGRVTFTSLDPTDSLTTLFQQKPDGTTVIDGGKIATDSISAKSAILWDNLTILNSNGSTTFAVGVNPQTGLSSPGDVYIQGTVQSTNYSPGIAGWQIDASGSAEFNAATFRGNVEVGYSDTAGYHASAGILSGQPTQTNGVDDRMIRFWAGPNSSSAPFKVYSNGDLEAMQGTFAGTFSGKVTVGNITIEDDAASSNNASITLADNNGNAKIILAEASASFLNGSAIFGNSSSTFATIDSTNKIMKFGSAGDVSIDYNNNKLSMKQYNLQGVTDGLTFTSTGTGLNDFIFTNPTGDAVTVMHGTLTVDSSVTIGTKVTMRQAKDSGGNVVGMDFVIN